jgi:hypothetical protein
MQTMCLSESCAVGPGGLSSERRSPIGLSRAEGFEHGHEKTCPEDQKCELDWQNATKNQLEFDMAPG